jgi:hypothetical protein
MDSALCICEINITHLHLSSAIRLKRSARGGGWVGNCVALQNRWGWQKIDRILRIAPLFRLAGGQRGTRCAALHNSGVRLLPGRKGFCCNAETSCLTRADSVRRIAEAE